MRRIAGERKRGLGDGQNERRITTSLRFVYMYSGKSRSPTFHMDCLSSPGKVVGGAKECDIRSSHGLGGGTCSTKRCQVKEERLSGRVQESAAAGRHQKVEGTRFSSVGKARCASEQKATQGILAANISQMLAVDRGGQACFG